MSLPPPHLDLALWHLLEACRVNGVAAPKGTGHIRCDGAVCFEIAHVTLRTHGTPINLRVVHAAFEGLPVKQAHGVVFGTAIKIRDLMDRDQFLRRYADKRLERERRVA